MSYSPLPPAQFTEPQPALFPGAQEPAYLTTSQVYWTSTPQPVICPHCHSTMTSYVKYTAGAVTWLMCIGICVVGGVAGCCLIPFCVPKLQDCSHYCSDCEALLHRKAAL